MKKVSLFVSTRHGQTLKIANFIMRQVQAQSDHPISFVIHQISKAGDHRGIENDTDIVIVGAPVYAQRFPRAIVKWVRANRQSLMAKTSAFYSVSLNAVDKRPECRAADDSLLRKFIHQTDWVPDFIASLGGALKYSSYNWWIRHLLKRISASSGGPTDIRQDYELTDWKVVEDFTKALVKSETNSQFAIRQRLSQAFIRSHSNKKLLKTDEKIVHA